MPALTGERKRNLASRETLFEEASYCSRKVHANVVEEIFGIGLEGIIHANCECGCHCEGHFLFQIAEILYDNSSDVAIHSAYF